MRINKRLDKQELAKLPATINKEQLRIVGHMSKRTAAYLLENNIIPSVHSGKKTRCYSIKKTDVIKFFKDLDLHPEKYVELGRTTTDRKLLGTSALPTCKYNKRKLRAYYKTLFEEYEDEVLTVAQVSEITGYRNTSITSWIRDEKLEAFDMPTMYMIPKVFLLKWLLSDQYNSIERKSKKHVKALWGND